MRYEIRDREIHITELDAFLADYAKVCKKHGMQFEVGDYEYDGGAYGAYLTIKGLDGGKPFDPHLNLDKADASIPCIMAARATIEAQCDREERQHRRELAEARQAQDEVLIREGLILGGQRYKLVELAEDET